ncbi:MAG: F-type H+/Na+-transporting ATPase subunit alpha, partial [Campylobacterota bacterium]|nr:F-type H+/Na+-transporting ATPase subunit alpha [Campylobacterota bacterium]
PFLEAKYPSILENIRSTKKIDNDTEAALKKALEDFLTVFSAN